MQVLKAIAEIDAKRFLRVSWVVHVSFLILVSAFLILVLPDRAAGWLPILEILLAAVGIEWAAAAGGGNLKRLTEAVLTKAEKGKK